nr:macrocin O-methyltransferase [Deltaproteobacteria bacterium]
MQTEELRSLYLDLMQRCLANTIYFQPYGEISRSDRENGRDWPRRAHTMIGCKRLNNIRFCMDSILQEQIPGDVMETGVWQGGAVIFMRAILKAYGVNDRIVWAADSFEGLPAPDINAYPADQGLELHRFQELAISLETVKANFAAYDLLDKQVRFIKGWFRDTLPHAPVQQLALLRLDGDLYESTWLALQHLYPRLSVGGYLIVDDYGAIEACRQAVDTYRRDHHITADLVKIDWTGVYWRKQL